jgi:hypothetical protein
MANHKEYEAMRKYFRDTPNVVTVGYLSNDNAQASANAQAMGEVQGGGDAHADTGAESPTEYLRRRLGESLVTVYSDAPPPVQEHMKAVHLDEMREKRVRSAQLKQKKQEVSHARKKRKKELEREKAKLSDSTAECSFSSLLSPEGISELEGYLSEVIDEALDADTDENAMEACDDVLGALDSLITMLSTMHVELVATRKQLAPSDSQRTPPASPQRPPAPLRAQPEQRRAAPTTPRPPPSTAAASRKLSSGLPATGEEAKGATERDSGVEEGPPLPTGAALERLERCCDVHQVVKVMRLCPNDGEVQGRALDKLAKATHGASKGHGTTMRVEDVCRAIASAMHQHLNSPVVQKAGCLALLQAAKAPRGESGEFAGSSLVYSGAVLVVLSSMETCSGSAEVQVAGCALVSALPLRHGSKDNVEEGRCVSVLLSAIVNHPASEPVQAAASQALRQFPLYDYDGRPKPAASISPIVAIMKQHPDSLAVQKEGCRLLRGLKSSDRVTALTLITASDLVMIMQQHPEIAALVFSVLASLAGESLNRPPIISSIDVPALLSSIKEPSLSPEQLKATCSLLVSLGADEAGRNTMVAAGGIGDTLSAIKRAVEGLNKVVVEGSLGLLLCLAADVSNRQAILSAGGVATLMSIFQAQARPLWDSIVTASEILNLLCRDDKGVIQGIVKSGGIPILMTPLMSCPFVCWPLTGLLNLFVKAGFRYLIQQQHDECPLPLLQDKCYLLDDIFYGR